MENLTIEIELEISGYCGDTIFELLAENIILNTIFELEKKRTLD